MSNGTTEMLGHGLQRIMLIAVNRGISSDSTSSLTEQIEVKVRFLIFQRSQRNEPPIVRVDSVKDNGIFEATQAKRLVHLRNGKLIHGDNVFLRTFVLSKERPTVVRAISCLSLAAFAILVKWSMQLTVCDGLREKFLLCVRGFTSHDWKRIRWRDNRVNVNWGYVCYRVFSGHSQRDGVTII